MAHEFLSDDWFAAVSALEAPPTPAAMQGVTINMVVTRPDGDIEAHMGDGKITKGLADGAQTTITVPFDTAKALFVKRDQQAAMQAFMSGQIKVTGDMTKLMAAGTTPPSPEAEAFGQQILELTAD
ncbi:MAG TPA: SCP2 sterol-binding domain-containing protein [Acidimicrobiales bacterium]|nr:SCP2 sterol-binding domain-containing protein [Acidimicrobiales bacterium]